MEVSPEASGQAHYPARAHRVHPANEPRQPILGEDKINEELRVKFGVNHSTSTIRKYMARRRPRRDGQKWRTFIKNHSHDLCACDFMTQYTELFTTAAREHAAVQMGSR